MDTQGKRKDRTVSRYARAMKAYFVSVAEVGQKSNSRCFWPRGNAICLGRQRLGELVEPRAWVDTWPSS